MRRGLQRRREHLASQVNRNLYVPRPTQHEEPRVSFRINVERVNEYTS